MFKQEFILLVYNKDVTCVIDEGQVPVCKVSERIKRRSNNKNDPSHDPYIPRNDSLLFNCSTECLLTSFTSMTELASPHLKLKSCFTEITKDDSYGCESIRYNHFKNIDKILFLSKTIPNKSFYLVDCLIYTEGGRICHKKDNDGSYTMLVDTGAIARPNETNVLAQDEFICEENEDKEVRCDLNPYVPFDEGLKLKKTIKFGDNVILKTGTSIIELKRDCIELWCGYTGKAVQTRRQFSYSPPGGKIFRCFYANRQQVCKRWADPQMMIYNERGWLDGRH